MDNLSDDKAAVTLCCDHLLSRHVAPNQRHGPVLKAELNLEIAPGVNSPCAPPIQKGDALAGSEVTNQQQRVAFLEFLNPLLPQHKCTPCCSQPFPKTPMYLSSSLSDDIYAPSRARLLFRYLLYSCSVLILILYLAVPTDFLITSSTFFSIPTQSYFASRSQNGSTIAILTTWNGPDTLQLNISNRIRAEYGEKWGYDIHFFREMDTGRKPYWDRMFAVREVLQNNPDTQWVWLVDVDLTIMSLDKSLEEHVFKPLDLEPFKTKDDETLLIISYDCNQLNTGSMFLRNDPRTNILLDFWMDPAFEGWTFDEQDAISHIVSHVPWALQHTVIAPPRMINAYLPMTCPLRHVFGYKQRSQLDPTILDRVRKVPGYDYGDDETYGWDNFDFDNTNWLATPRIIWENDEERELTKQELQIRYKNYTEANDLEYKPLMLSPGLDFPSMMPYYSAKHVDGWESKLSEPELKRLHWTYWSDNRVRDGRWHYRPGDLVVHTAGCHVSGEDCSAIMQAISDTRDEINDGTFNDYHAYQ